MFNRIIFYFHQASSNLKRSILIILSISIAISMVAGALYYSNSFEETSLTNGFSNVTDISVYSYSSAIDFSSNLVNSYSKITNAVNQSGLDIVSSFEYGFLNKNSNYIYRDFSNSSTVENMSLNAFIADDNFYKSNEFSHYFTLYEGKLPTNNSEILMDITALNHFNYHVGEKVNLTLYYGNSSDIYFNYTLHDITISGAYHANLRYYQIIGQNYYETYNQQLKYFERSPIFSYENFSKELDNNPFQQFSNFVLTKYNNSPSLLSHIGFQFGVGLEYNKNSIHFSNLKSSSQEISNQIHLLVRNIPTGYIVANFITSELYYLTRSISDPLNALLIFIAPFLIFALIIGSFSISNISSRFDEFLLLESKGTPKTMIRNQLLTETFLIGIISAILSILFGFLAYEFYKKFFGNILFFNLNQVIPTIHLFINWSSIGIITLSCIAISLFSSIAGIRKMNKVQISELLSTMGDEGVTIEYDEETLFGKKTTTDLSDSNDLNDEPQNLEIKQIKKSKKLKKSSGIDAIDGNLKYYKDHIKRSQKKIPKVSYFLVIISLFPLIFYILGAISMKPNAPDILLNFQQILSRYYFFISILCIISPVLMAIGVMRFLSKESPSRYAKITRFLSKPFLKANSYLVSLEMIKRKKFRKIMYIIGIFVSILVFSNCVFNSMSRYPLIQSNLGIGGDLKLSANVQAQNSLYNTSYTQTIDNSLKNLTNSKGVPIINNILTYYKQSEISGQTVYYFNFTNYLQVIQEGGKFVPKNVITELSAAITYDNNASNKYPGAIVDSAFLNINHYEIGDLIHINHTQYDPQTNLSMYTPITAKIIAAYDLLPGITFDQYGFLYQLRNSNNLAIDFGTFNQSSQLLNTSTINQLVNLNLKAESNQTIIQQQISSMKLDKITYSSYIFYNQQWNSPLPVGSLTSSGFYGLIYFEFIILGVILSLGLASILNSFQTSNRYFFGLLMSRGFGKGGIFRFMITQLIIVFFLAMISGIIIGSITSTIFLKMTINVSSPILASLGLPIFFTPLGIAEVLGIVLGVSFIAYIASYYIQMRKSLSQYMRKF